MEDNETLYVLLTDGKNRGTVVKSVGSEDYVFEKETKTWKRTGMLTKYFNDESPYYDLYEDISEQKAMELINKM